MKRSQPMKRTAFKPARPLPSPPRARPVPVLLRPLTVAHAVMAPVSAAVQAEPKTELVRSAAYLRLVAALPCRICRLQGHSQAAHPNTGKGMALKTDDRRAFPLCADDAGRRGCHSLFDQGALYDKTTRRLLEDAWGEDTRRRLTIAGLWPAGVPHWIEEQEGNL